MSAKGLQRRRTGGPASALAAEQLHDHVHVHVHGADLAQTRRSALWLAGILNAIFLFVEVGAGLMFHSLALLADGVHMLGDVVALAFALGAAALAARPPTQRHTYGLGRAEVVAAQVNALVLLLASGWIVVEAVGRVGHSASDVRGGGVIAVASIGLIINVVSAVVLARSAGANLNMRGAYLHMATDALGSAAALLAGVGIVLWSANWLDPTASIIVALLTVIGGWKLLRDATNVLLEATPSHLTSEAIVTAILGVATVTAVHHVHLWSLASEQTALSAHVVLDEEQTLHDAQTVSNEIKTLLTENFGITHTTLELECHACEPSNATPAYAGGDARC